MCRRSCIADNLQKKKWMAPANNCRGFSVSAATHPIHNAVNLHSLWI